MGARMSYGISVTVRAPFAETVTRVREALAGQGSGVLTETDVTATLREKLGEQMEEYVILGPGRQHGRARPGGHGTCPRR